MKSQNPKPPRVIKKLQNISELEREQVRSDCGKVGIEFCHTHTTDWENGADVVLVFATFRATETVYTKSGEAWSTEHYGEYPNMKSAQRDLLGYWRKEGLTFGGVRN